MSRAVPLAILLLVLPLAHLPSAPAAAGTGAYEARPGQWIVAFHDLQAAAVEDGTWAGYEVVSVNRALGLIVVDTVEPATLLTESRTDDNVRYVEWDDPHAFTTLFTPNDPRYPEQYGFEQIQAPTAWDTTLGATSVLVGVVDTGIDGDHPDLVGIVADEHDFVNNDPVANDACGHGTHVAGTLAANTDNGVGVAGTARASLLVAKALSNTLIIQCTGSSSDIADAITWATDRGAHVISMSIGTSSRSAAMADAVAYAWRQGVLLVAAAGNGGPCSDCVDYPAAFPEVIAVTCTDEEETQCSFSSDGPESELAAPGKDVLSTYNDGGYRRLSGTSMSTPHVAGVAALMLSVNASLTNQELRDILTGTAQDLGEAGWDPLYGHGEVDAALAVAAVPDGGGGGGGDEEPNQAPSASFQVACTELACSLDASGSSDPDGTLTAYHWDLGDGTTATGQTTNHTYETGGTYTVTLTVTDDDGVNDTTSQEITVSADPAGTVGLDEDFESGDPGWAVTNSGSSATWQLTEARSSSPETSMAITGYGAHEADHLVTEPVDLSGLASPTLTVSSWMEGERGCFLFSCTTFDWGRIQVTADGGASWTTLEDDHWSTGGAWETLSYDLGAFQGETVQVRFSFFSDGSVHKEGWYIDDIVIVGS